MTAIIGFDADQDCSRVAALLKERGGGFIARYLKNLSLAEAGAILHAGLEILLIFETTAERALDGAGAGAADGAKARNMAAALGAPQGVAIVATVDFDATEAQEPTVLTYLRGFKAGLAGQAKLMVYANGAICAAALDGRVADYTWLAGGSGMRGTQAFKASGRATIIQDVGDKRGLDLGISIDSDVAYTEDFGGWSLTPAASVASPPPAASTIAIPAARDLQAALVAEGRDLGNSGPNGDGVDDDWGPLSQAALAAHYGARSSA